MVVEEGNGAGNRLRTPSSVDMVKMAAGPPSLLMVTVTPPLVTVAPEKYPEFVRGSKVKGVARAGRADRADSAARRKSRVDFMNLGSRRKSLSEALKESIGEPSGKHESAQAE